MYQVKEIPLVLVIWEDACKHDVDRLTRECISDYGIWTNFTVGHLIEEDDKCVRLVSEISITDDKFPNIYEGLKVIPKSCIVNRVALSEVISGTEVLCSDVGPGTKVS